MHDSLYPVLKGLGLARTTSDVCDIALDGIRSAFGARCGGVLFFDGASAPSERAAMGICDRDVEEYLRRWRAIDRVFAAAAKRGSPTRTVDVYPGDSLIRDPLYTQYGRRVDIFHYNVRPCIWVSRDAAYLDDGTGNLAAKPFYASTNWEDPEPLANSLQVAAGSRIRFECDYDNTAGTANFFQGQSALTNEMCVFAATYYPAIDPDTDFCMKGADMFGSGQTSCSDTVACLGQCQPNGGDDAGSSGGAMSATHCQQACIVQGCPAFSDTALGLAGCISRSCSAECGPTSDDAGAALDARGPASDAGTSSSVMVSDACRSCLGAACPAVAVACANDTTCGT